LVLVLMKVPKQ